MKQSSIKFKDPLIPDVPRNIKDVWDKYRKVLELVPPEKAESAEGMFGSSQWTVFERLKVIEHRIEQVCVS